jgi:hypothetical protein
VPQGKRVPRHYRRFPFAATPLEIYLRKKSIQSGECCVVLRGEMKHFLRIMLLAPTLIQTQKRADAQLYGSRARTRHSYSGSFRYASRARPHSMESEKKREPFLEGRSSYSPGRKFHRCIGAWPFYPCPLSLSRRCHF